MDWSFQRRKGERLTFDELGALAADRRDGGPVGVNLHHAVMDGGELELLGELCDVLAAHLAGPVPAAARERPGLGVGMPAARSATLRSARAHWRTKRSGTRVNGGSVSRRPGRAAVRGRRSGCGAGSAPPTSVDLRRGEDGRLVQHPPAAEGGVALGGHGDAFGHRGG